MVESFVGKWKVDLSTTTGLDEFWAVVEGPKEKLEAIRNLSYSLEFSVSGDTITCTVAYDADFPPQTYNFKLGDTFTYHDVDGNDPKLRVTMEGGRLVEDYVLGEGKWQTLRQIDGNVMTATTSARGQTVVQKLFKQ